MSATLPFIWTTKTARSFLPFADLIASVNVSARHQTGIRIDIGKNDFRTHMPRDIRGRRKCHRRNDDPFIRLQIDRHRGEMQRCRSAIDGHRLSRVHGLGEFHFELVDQRPGRQDLVMQRLRHGGNVVLADE